MKKFIKINFIVLIIFIACVINSNFSIASNLNTQNVTTVELNNSNQTETEDNKDLDKLQEEKSSLESNIEESNNQIEIVKAELSDLLIKVEEITLEISNKNEEIDKLTIENKELNGYIKNVENDLKKIKNDYENKKEILDKRLIASYERGQTSYLDVLLNSDGIISFFSNYYLLSEIISADNKLIEDCSKAKIYMEELDSSLIEKSAKLEQNKATIQKNKISLENMEALKSKRISQLSESEAELYKKIEEYQSEIENVEKEIRLLTLANVGSEYIGGTMAWPVPGYTRITSQFGMRTHPITGIYKLHTGTDIGAPMGATFIAANDGIVIKAEYNNAYGNMVIIDHGGGITTLYGHGSEILVNVGDQVLQGTPVLKVGSTGYSTGPHAHFEVRVNGEYKNPLDYITSYNSAGVNTSENNNDANTKNNVEEVVINN